MIQWYAVILWCGVAVLQVNFKRSDASSGVEPPGMFFQFFAPFIQHSVGGHWFCSEHWRLRLEFI